MRKNRMSLGMLTTAFVSILGGTISGGSVEVYNSPSFAITPIGTETPSWNWKNGSPHAEGYYTNESKDSFYLEGNGHSIYQCWDEAGFAFVDEVPLTGDFQLTARFADLPEEGPGSVGLTLKADLQAHSPVLDLRWDYYYPETAGNPNGLRWFNRITPQDRIGLCPTCENGLCQGTDCHPSCTSDPESGECWQGCLNMGYENFADPEGGFTENDGIWVRVRREGVKFFLYAAYDTTEWKEIQPVSLMNTPLGYFRLPGLLESNVVFAGFSVVGVDQGGHIQTATFDNISLEVYSYGTSTNPGITNDAVSNATPRLKLVGSTVQVPAGTNVRKAEYFGAMGKKMGTLIREGDNFVLPNHGSLPSGVYWIRMRMPDGSVTIPYVKQ